MGRMMDRYSTKIGHVFRQTDLKGGRWKGSGRRVPLAEGEECQPDTHDGSEEVHPHPGVDAHQDHRAFQAEFEEPVVHYELNAAEETPVKVPHGEPGEDELFEIFGLAPPYPHVPLSVHDDRLDPEGHHGHHQTLNRGHFPKRGHPPTFNNFQVSSAFWTPSQSEKLWLALQGPPILTCPKSGICCN